ncbi:MAG: methyltransferase domain-containing protein [Candidatus Omnitrophica bacterium]|nr:methyltransferase domain-containing protein [Candidatus Omnitrophota bacterium]
MKKGLLDHLVCPECKGPLTLRDEVMEQAEVKTGLLISGCGKKFNIVDFIPRFVSEDKYVKSFSFEWQVHNRTQVDSFSGYDISSRQFQGRVDFPLSQLKGKLVLDAGCGTGRFSEVALKNGATVVGVDLSFSVDVAFKNMGRHPCAHFIQADLFNLPFAEEAFDFIFSFGVLHHTPDAAKAFRHIAGLVKPRGEMSIFVYSSYNKGIVYSSAFWRFFTTRLPKRILYYLSFIAVPLYYLYRIPVLGSICKMLFVIPMWKDWRWRVLDTFDWYSPKYQSKHTHWEVFRWFEESGFGKIKILENEITMMGTKGA